MLSTSRAVSCHKKQSQLNNLDIKSVSWHNIKSVSWQHQERFKLMHDSFLFKERFKLMQDSFFRVRWARGVIMPKSVSDAASRKKTGGRKAADDCCWCHRQWTSPNPIRECGGCLPRRKGYGPRCDICVAVFGKYYKGVDANVHDEKMTKDTEYADAFKVCVETYEDLRNNDPKRHATIAPFDGPVTKIKEVREHSR